MSIIPMGSYLPTMTCPTLLLTRLASSFTAVNSVAPEALAGSGSDRISVIYFILSAFRMITLLL